MSPSEFRSSSAYVGRSAAVPATSRLSNSYRSTTGMTADTFRTSNADTYRTSNTSSNTPSNTPSNRTADPVTATGGTSLGRSMSPRSFSQPATRSTSTSSTARSAPDSRSSTAGRSPSDAAARTDSLKDVGARADTRGTSATAARDTRSSGRATDRGSRADNSLAAASRERANTPEARALDRVFDDIDDAFDDFDDAFDDAFDDFDDFFDDLEDHWHNHYGNLFGYYNPWFWGWNAGWGNLFPYGFNRLFHFHHPFFYRYSWYHHWYGYYPIYDHYFYPQYVTYTPQTIVVAPNVVSAAPNEVVVYYPAYAEPTTANQQPAATPHIPPELAHQLQTLGNNDNAVELLEQGARLFKAGDYTAAADALRRSMLAEPGNAVPKFALAHALFALGDYDYAAFLIRRGMAILPEWPRVGTSLHELYGEPKDLEEHLIGLNVYVNSHPTAVEARFLLGYVSYFAANLDGAEAAFDEAARLRNGQVEVAAFQARIAEIRAQLEQTAPDPTATSEGAGG